MDNDMADTAADAGPLQSFPYGGGSFEIRPEGVFYAEPDSERFVCSPLDVSAQTLDATGNAWGRLLRWKDPAGNPHRWAMPMALLSGDSGAEFRAELMGGGLDISPNRKERTLLAAYIQKFPTDRRVRCVERLGWHGCAYVLPTEIVGGDGSEAAVFQNPHMVEPAFSVSGTERQWRERVASLAAGNSRLTFAASVGFAGPLLDVVGMEGGGFHLCGGSSKGKSTAQVLAASVWGDPARYKRSWRTTSNALESMALLSNDGLLVLDEIREINPKEIGAAVYMLANGQAKGRADKSGLARRVQTWKMLFLSSGEIGLSELMRQAGERANAGQEIRLAEIGIGDFEDIHGCGTPGRFADALRENAGRYHGAVGLEYLRQLVERRGKQAEAIRGRIDDFVSSATPEGVAGQVARVARRFGLAAVAGELATVFGLTGWPEGAADEAARTCLGSWVEGFGGTGDREARQTLSQVKAFFEAHGASRFADMNEVGDSRTTHRAGFYKVDISGGRRERTYYVLPEAFRQEVCRGLDHRTAAKTLVSAGWIEPGSDGRPTQKPRIPALDGKPTRVYAFNGKMWECDPC
jgi:uncharacterized protein (DUF927 family)